MLFHPPPPPTTTAQPPEQLQNWSDQIVDFPFIISPNEVFGDIMVLAAPPPPPVDPDDVNTLKSKSIQRISFKFYMRVDTPLRYFAIEI